MGTLLITLPLTHITGKIMVHQDNGIGEVNIFILFDIKNALNFTHINFTKMMHVFYHHESNVELPHPPSLTMPKLLAPRYGT